MEGNSHPSAPSPPFWRGRLPHCMTATCWSRVQAETAVHQLDEQASYKPNHSTCLWNLQVLQNIVNTAINKQHISVNTGFIDSDCMTLVDLSCSVDREGISAGD